MRRLGSVVSQALVVVGAVLLLSMGGAIFAAPIIVPACWVVLGRSSRGWRIAAATVLSLTMVEVAWALTYVSLGEAQPAIWLVPLLGGAAALVLSIARSSRTHLVPA